MATTSPNPNEAPTDELGAALAQWRRQVESELKGAPFDKKLVTRTAEGIALQPLYTRKDVADLPHLTTQPGEAPFLRGFRAPAKAERRWECAQEIAAHRAYEFNRALLADLLAGQDSVALTPDLATRGSVDPDEAGPDQVGEGGVSLMDSDDVEAAFRGVDLAAVPLHIKGGAEPLALAGLVLSELRKRGLNGNQLRGSLTVDPIGFGLETGKVPADWPILFDQMAGWVKWAAEQTPAWRTVGVDASVWHEAGGAATHELAYALATGVEYVRALLARGLAIEVIVPRLRFTFAAGQQFFMEVAKFRAWRLLWTRAVVALGGAPELAGQSAVHARTGHWGQTLLDPQVNLLRATTAALSAVVGEVDSLHVSPFDETTGRTNDFSRRIARNLHTLIAEEFRFTAPVDAAGGSWYVESVTDQLARKAWALFQGVEKDGGMLAAITRGQPQQAVAAAAQERSAALANRRSTMVGTNIFPNFRDKLPASRRPELEALRITRGRAAAERRGAGCARAAAPQAWPACLQAAIAAARDGATLGQLAKLGRPVGAAPVTVPALPRRRGAEAFEELRAQSARCREKPKVFLAKMGPVVQHKARADFSTGFFAVGGFEPIAKRTFETADDAATAAVESGAPVAVLCSTDETYPELVPAFARAIKAARPTMTVVLAGLPADPAVVATYRAAGVDEFIHLRADVTEVLGKLLNSLEASS